MTKRLFEIDPWILATDQLAVADKRLQESLTSIGNGYMGMRGNFEESYSGDTHQGTYLAGVWFPDKTRVGWWKNGYPKYFGKAINSPDFLSIPIKVNGETLDLAKTEFHDFKLELDMHDGVLRRSFIAEIGGASVRFSFLRFMSNVTQELALINLEAEVLSGQAELTLEPLINGNVHNEDSNYDETFWELRQQGQLADDNYFVTMETKENPFGTPRFTITEQMHVVVDSAVAVDRKPLTEKSGRVGEAISAHLTTGQVLTLRKQVVVVTSRDVPEAQQVSRATTLIQAADQTSLVAQLAAQDQVWAQRWAQSDVQINGDPAAQQGIRFNISQLFMTYYGEDSRLNVGPKGFTGEKYGGATYWDTEAYIVPMYVSVTKPQVTRQLLEYRYDQLAGAYHNAQQQGLKGALYPMVTFDGIECHNEWEITFEEIHRNGAVAHAIYEYTDYTGDTDYVLTKGIDVLVGIARFWADRVHFSKRHQQYMIHGVTGPNEYENNVNNNWYTNQMATWVLRYTLEILPQVSDAKQHALAVSTEEQAYWQDIIARMYYPVDDQEGIFVQNDGYLDKDLRPVSSLDPSERPLNQHWSWDKILRSPFIKQADVLQGIYFLDDQFTLAEKKRNFDFYEPMTVHESSLSACIYSIIAAEIGEEDKAVELYSRTARLDLDNYNNDTADGLHITSMSGGWLSIVQGFAGLRHQHGQLSLKPFCPKDWDSYRFQINFRGRLLAVTVDHHETKLELLKGTDLALTVNGQPQIVKADQVLTVTD
ncbi:glycoside hydrolase family 65 protein [Lapidilactobacillus luobeiensis]|uniref:glycoside hydrolase family 65 protein n=1 Tax=Lapidilactobacillus luobeiensis TaxID=2950371 RepID=UPI0021C42329|nr:glycoside hydrolase family 65 protein [Lapidilactobacillus luobeiensis]